MGGGADGAGALRYLRPTDTRAVVGSRPAPGRGPRPIGAGLEADEIALAAWLETTTH